MKDDDNDWISLGEAQQQEETEGQMHLIGEKGNPFNDEIYPRRKITIYMHCLL